MISTYALSWNEASFSSKLALFFQSGKDQKKKIGSASPKTRAKGYSALSSTYYSIVGTAFCQLKMFWQHKPRFVGLAWIFLWCLTWLPLAAWCYWRMLHLSNKVVALIGYHRMSPEQCDIRQSILRRRGKYDEAQKCIESISDKIESLTTRALLLLGLADIHRVRGDRESVKKSVTSALMYVSPVEEEDSHQAIRIYRNAAGLLDFAEGKDSKAAHDCRKKAAVIAARCAAVDQLLKLRCPA